MQGDNAVDDELYRELILDHYRNPRNRGRMEEASVRVEGKNPLCGDRLELALKIEGDSIRESRVEAHGCSISQASASMMSEAIAGRSLKEAEGFVSEFKKMMLQGGDPEGLPAPLEDLKSLEGVKRYPVRVKCALLAWNALLQSIEDFRKGRIHGNGR
jgi:nitrogen fixation NifU-like protein